MSLFDLKAMQSKRVQLVETARSIYRTAESEGRQPSSEEQRNFDLVMGDAERLADDIRRIEKLEAVQKSLSQSTGNPLRREQPGRRPDGVGYRGQYFESKGEDAELRAFDDYLRTGDASELRALQSDVSTAGGYAVTPQQLARDLVKAVDDLMPIRQRATKYQLATAQSVGILSIDNDPADATWVSELATGSDDTTMSFGKRELCPHPLAQRLKVSDKLLRLAPNAAQIVTERLAYKLAYVQENAFMTGNGANKPLGIFTASSAGISTARDVSTGNTSSAITMDGLINALYTLKSPYLTSPTLAWCFHRSALAQIRKLRSDSGAGAGTGDYLWEPSTQLGQPDRLLGVPVFSSEFCPATFTTGLYVGCIADWKYYHIADALDFQLKRLDELYAETNQVGFISRSETDAMPVLEEAFVRVKLA